MNPIRFTLFSLLLLSCLCAGTQSVAQPASAAADSGVGVGRGSITVEVIESTKTDTHEPAKSRDFSQSARYNPIVRRAQQTNDLIIRKPASGPSEAAYRLGHRYLNGLGVEKDDKRARKWLEQAARAGHLKAYEELKNSDSPETLKDETGRIIQSATARQEFMKQTGFPDGRPGHVIVHILRIEDGGADTAENLKWMKIADALKSEGWNVLPDAKNALE